MSVTDLLVAAEKRIDNLTETILDLRAENDELKAYYKRIMDETCGDEIHCTCVPILKRQLDEQKKFTKLLVENIQTMTKAVDVTDIVDGFGALRAELDKKDAALEEALDTIGKVANYNDNEYTVESLVDMCWDFLSAHPTEAAAEYAAMKEQLDKAVAWHEGDDSPHARLEQTIAALRAENKNHRDMNLLMNDTNNRLRSEIKQTRAENEKLRNTLCLDNNDRPSRLWKLFDENGRLEAAVEEARGLMDELFTWETVYEWEKVREHYRAWLTAHPQEEK